MSNKIVSQVYRSIIDDVINNVHQDFEEMGIEKEVLEELQRSWEAKIVATQVAEFEGAPALPPAKSRSSKKPDPKSEVKSEDANGQASGSNGSASDQHRSKVARADGSTDVASAAGSAASAGGAETKPEDDEAAAGQKRKRISDDDEIGSDLDDSDDEDLDGGADGDNDDMVLCLYDKVQRIKNKWKCVLKDGVASIDGRDYLFAKCNGEFEW
ncbi:related to TOA1-transcription factor TFIIA-L [Sporisorium reilianum f. sp. reilianum]|uniref:Transcription initiation factor IIA large subunit n=1 Tax=Sporisorium reilianum f. sp. reilianum TaxID=72559 RepID=A0A2N8UB48_9BASI|nr:related to TOA1-transcription factor TFIIA-L [Sporisorium reilianum f. sp. reilianum]